VIAAHQHMDFDDIVAAVNETGLGSLDIVPDDDSVSQVPHVSAIIYNDAGGNARFGMSIPQVRVGDFSSTVPRLDLVIPPAARARVNIGVRAGADGGEMLAILTRVNGTKFETRRPFGADFFSQMTASDYMATQVNPGDLISIYGTGIFVYASETNNATNDPVFHSAFANANDESLNVGSYFK
jgi:hypothetical protein